MKFLASVVASDGLTVVDSQPKALTDFGVNQWFLSALESMSAGQTVQVRAQNDADALPEDWPAPFVAEGPPGPQGEQGPPGEPGADGSGGNWSGYLETNASQNLPADKQVIFANHASGGLMLFLPLLSGVPVGHVIIIRAAGQMVPVRARNAAAGSGHEGETDTVRFLGIAGLENGFVNVNANQVMRFVSVGAYWMEF